MFYGEYEVTLDDTKLFLPEAFVDSLLGGEESLCLKRGDCRGLWCLVPASNANFVEGESVCSYGLTDVRRGFVALPQVVLSDLDGDETLFVVGMANYIMVMSRNVHQQKLDSAMRKLFCCPGSLKDLGL